jgi:serine protein kinase
VSCSVQITNTFPVNELRDSYNKVKIIVFTQGFENMVQDTTQQAENNLSDIFDEIQQDVVSRKEEEMTLQDYLDLCKRDSMAYASPAERLLAAFGEPKLIDTRDDQRLSRIFMNRQIKVFPSIADEFFGMEETLEQIHSFLKHSSQGLEERKQILYLRGPVGGGKSSLAEKLKDLMEIHPIYVLKAGDMVSPVFESPLGLFNMQRHAKLLEDKFGIPARVLGSIMSPWAVKRLKEFKGKIDKFKVVKMYPSRMYQIAITKTEPGDENTQDITSLVGKVDIRALKSFSQSDADAYSYTGGLCLANQGLLEFVEMFKAPIKMLHPLLTATQEGNYNTVEGAPIPFKGIILAHSNESEWDAFKNNKNNEAFLDRVYTVRVPYCLRTDEETSIYRKLIRHSSLKDAPCASGTLEMMAKFAVLTRIKETEHSTSYSKMKVYNGENLKDTDPHAKSIQEYRDIAGVDEGMTGVSTRFAYKILSKTFNYDSSEVAANPVHLMIVLINQIEQEKYPQTVAEDYIKHVKKLSQDYQELIEKEIKSACLDSYADYGQNIFENYLAWADSWIQDGEYRDPNNGITLNREALDGELSKIEKPAGIGNPKDFRNEIVNFALRERAKNGGKTPSWTSYTKIKEVIEKKIFNATDDIIPVITFNAKGTKDDQEKHKGFLDRMKARGYTQKQCQILVDWWIRSKKNV